MKTFQRILAVVLCLVMSLSVLGTVAFAAEGDPQTTAATIDTSKTGSITVYKYEYNGTNNNDKGTGLQSESSKLPMDKDAPNDPSKTAIALEGVTFKIYQVKNTEDTIAYYNGEATKSVTVASFLENGKIKSEYSEYTEYKNGRTTREDGKVEFTNLPVGMYVIVESAAPENVTKAVEPFLVSIPMTHPTNLGEWMYDVYVYPKNSTSEGNVTLKKTDDKGNALSGVTFKLEKETATAGTYAQVGENIATTSTGEIGWSDLAYGNYKITEVSAPDGYIVDLRPIEFTVTQNNTIECVDDRASIAVTGNKTANLVITLKNAKPDVKKEIVVSETTTDETNASVGDTVSYKVTVDVPSNITELNTFTLTDTPTNLNDTNSTIVITCPDAEEGKTVLTNGIHYTVSDDTANGFTITFVPSAMGDYAGKQLVVTYNAVVLADAATTGKAPNTIDLTYSNKIKPNTDTTPEGEDDKNHIEDSAIVYTYKIQVEKRLDSATGQKAAGVEFELYEGSSNDPIKVVGSDGNYRVATSDETNTITTLVTDAEGKIVVSGLDNGTYYLKETKTVDGYNLLSDKVKVELNISTETKWKTSSYFVQKNDVWYLVKKTETDSTTEYSGSYAATANYVTQTIVNKHGFTLPTTGGIGTLMFFIIGGVLIAGGICLITVPNKKRSV